ncbi:efflux RND transporter periplasmic adaptor subunit [Cerasicoccus arenae]|uniref:Efflux RND transporter periplasmic adaptor subunit n=1 Tax=Cerasicoccus arenae TaxID=424488 RepID=A0A8J3DEE7_9BACT|nr:efflux RND transporter periplasmic adaptor subunit [Cerasicoccus arenae]MBK1856946.1 efflux RND transporter periplasmic adaptor subunit [Cerasicoccus arenae]GHB89981.1 hypothetical protein GCM10007047_00700 [Cerasicoccus arenae]
MQRIIQLSILIGLGILSGCGKTDQTQPRAASPTVPTIYTCSMHPQIQQDGPGNCPICGMELVPMKSGDAANPRSLELSAAAIALADIQTSIIERGPATRTINLFGVITPDDTRVATVTARFPGRIERLFVNFVGTRVRKGEHLAEIYSDELVEAQSELIGALRYDSNKASAAGIKERLRLWDIPEDQIELIESTSKPVYRVRIDSPTGGVVTQLDVRDGDYVKTGSRLFEVTDLSKLWVHLDAYETDLSWLRYGQHVLISAKAYPAETFTGTIAFIQPMLDPKTRTVKVRVNVDNQDGKLRPGMFVRGTVEAHLGTGGKVVAPELAGKWIGPMHPEIVSDEPGDCPICGMPLEPASELGYAAYDPGEPPLLVPAEAVLRTGSRAVVYLQAEKGQFIGREIVLGPRVKDYFVVQSGLSEGDEVVTNGAFRIDSELQIKAQPSMMTPKTAEQAMPSNEVTTSDQSHPLSEDGKSTDLQDPVDIYSLHKNISQQFTTDDSFNVALNSALQSYFKLETKLDQVDFTSAQSAAAEVADKIKAIPMKGISPPAMKILMAEQVDGEQAAALLKQDAIQQRKPGLEGLSEALITLVQTFKWRGKTPLYLMHCPMVYDDRGARWLQNTAEVTNPYFGPDMLSCGEVLAVWNSQTASWDDPE